jgi:hypothetical protein
MAEKSPTAIPEDGEILTTISVKVPRWVEDEMRRVGRETDLDLSKTGRVELTELAKITRARFKRGPALSAFLEHLDIQPSQYDLFFQRRR